MKLIYKYSVPLLMVLAVSIGLLSCDDEETGTPFVNYVRVTNPAASDSLLVSAGQGQMVVIMGQNLQSVVEVWFNNRKALLIPTWITNSSIIVRVPEELPTEITNLIQLIFSDGTSLLYDFSVDVNEPLIDRMYSEYVDEGEEAIIYGQYFYEPLTVTFAGGVEGELISVDEEEIHVKVPAGAQPGPVVIANNFGVTESDFWFRDTRNMILSFDIPLSGSGDLWHPAPGGPSKVVSSSPDFKNVSGSFLLSQISYGSWQWAEMFTGVAAAPELADMKNIPQEALLNPAKYILKFEINSKASLTGAVFNFYIGNNVSGANRGYNADGDDNTYSWQPNFDTEGSWMTVALPWEDVYNDMGRFDYNSDGYDFSFVAQGPTGLTFNWAIDNIRIVPVVIE